MRSSSAPAYYGSSGLGAPNYVLRGQIRPLRGMGDAWDTALQIAQDSGVPTSVSIPTGVPGLPNVNLSVPSAPAIKVAPPPPPPQVTAPKSTVPRPAPPTGYKTTVVAPPSGMTTTSSLVPMTATMTTQAPAVTSPSSSTRWALVLVAAAAVGYVVYAHSKKKAA